jgi:RNA polymerase sigma factor (sigma-70 family)
LPKSALGMEEDNEFRAALIKAQSGDNEAAAELFARFSPQVKRIARIKLSSAAFRQRLDEEDICQSVFGVLFDGLREGRFVVDTLEDLQRLLADITRKRVLKQIERHKAAKRDVGKQIEAGDVAFDPMSDESTPSVKLSREELVGRFLASLSPEDRYVVQQRQLGRGWEEIATELKTSADALRVRVSRATKAACERLGIDPP